MNSNIQEYKQQRKKKRPHRKKRGRILCRLFIVLIVLAGALAIGVKFFVPSLLGKPLFPQAESILGISTSVNQNENKPGSLSAALEHLYSPYAVLVDISTGKKLAQHNSGERIYPASLTKIMTALIAIEHTENLDQTMILPYDFFESLYEEDASMAGFLPGEEVTLKDLLYGILLPSGAECCMAFAQRIAGSENGFVDLMNQKAIALGMDHTQFRNTTGLHDPEHYSTVGDIAVLLQYALKNDSFREVFTCRQYNTSPSEEHPKGLLFTGTMFDALENTEVAGGEIIGGKTGYTEEAGLCLASLAKFGQKEYILVTAKADGSHRTEQFHMLDALNVYGQIGKTGAGS